MNNSEQEDVFDQEETPEPSNAIEQFVFGKFNDFCKDDHGKTVFILFKSFYDEFDGIHGAEVLKAISDQEGGWKKCLKQLSEKCDIKVSFAEEMNFTSLMKRCYNEYTLSLSLASSAPSFTLASLASSVASSASSAAAAAKEQKKARAERDKQNKIKTKNNKINLNLLKKLSKIYINAILRFFNAILRLIYCYIYFFIYIFNAILRFIFFIYFLYIFYI